MGRDGRRDRGSGPSAVHPLLAGRGLVEHPFVSPMLGSGPRRDAGAGPSIGLARRLLGWRPGGGERTVTCIACGADVARGEAREYDKHGDRFDRGDKRFEHLCKGCHRKLDHKPRRGLEATLVEFEAGDRSREEFLAWYCDRVDEGDGSRDEPLGRG